MTRKIARTAKNKACANLFFVQKCKHEKEPERTGPIASILQTPQLQIGLPLGVKYTHEAPGYLEMLILIFKLSIRLLPPVSLRTSYFFPPNFFWGDPLWAWICKGKYVGQKRRPLHFMFSNSRCASYVKAQIICVYMVKYERMEAICLACGFGMQRA